LNTYNILGRMPVISQPYWDLLATSLFTVIPVVSAKRLHPNTLAYPSG